MTTLNPLLFLLGFVCVLTTANPQNFFKHHYEVIFERADVENLNKTVVTANASVTIFNRTTRPLNMRFRLLRELEEDSVICFSGYQFKSNQYRLTALQFSMKIRNALKLEEAGFDSLVNAAKPPIEWPLRKGVTYVIKDWLPDNQKMPFPYAPAGEWKDVLTFYADNRVTKAFDMNLYYRIEDIPDFN